MKKVRLHISAGPDGGILNHSGRATIENERCVSAPEFCHSLLGKTEAEIKAICAERGYTWRKVTA
jgi:hypothetical protein